MMSGAALGRPILYAGKEVLIHLSCKDANRNGLESMAWLLASEGFHHVLALSGDDPLETVAHLAGDRICVFDGAPLPPDDGSRGL